MRGDWRMACVTRARTVAAGVRFIEFALSGAPVALEAGATVDIVVGPRGAVHTFACLPAEPGSLRILVPRGDTAAARFMWALVEGAHVRGRLPVSARPQPPGRGAPAMRGLSTVRLAVAAAPVAGPSHAGGRDADPLRAEIFAFPRVRRAGSGAGADRGRTGAGNSSTV